MVEKFAIHWLEKHAQIKGTYEGVCWNYVVPRLLFLDGKSQRLINYEDAKAKRCHLKKLTCCSAQTRTRIGCLRKSPEVVLIPCH
jgi:hypothetical protein